MANIFGGSMFGGGFMGGLANGQFQAQGPQFGGGMMMNPMAHAQVTQEVPVNQMGVVTYTMGPGSARPKDRSGRMFGGNGQRQKRY